ncbi:hypothetical protein CBR_g40294 [Chara braunii]|uniref:Uncharacterized protein n=1 Tax=Chara braunii TaxID=69332 RepID=A0A388K1Z2_CHABU|nr:hypothetical protein CBR_g40294 [Chara braunii]|eukprot:GBG64047.1 hypothetical protein CBR_g40294 [Chara braunii]
MCREDTWKGTCLAMSGGRGSTGADVRDSEMWVLFVGHSFVYLVSSTSSLNWQFEGMQMNGVSFVGVLFAFFLIMR